MGRLAWWEKIPIPVMILSILLSPVRAWSEEIVVAEHGESVVQAVESTTDATVVEVTTELPIGIIPNPLYIDFDGPSISLVTRFVSGSVCKFFPHPLTGTTAPTVSFFSPGAAASPAGIAVIDTGGTAFVANSALGTVSAFSTAGVAGAPIAGSPFAVPGGAGSIPWGVAAGITGSPSASTVFVTRRGAAGTEGIITFPSIGGAGTVLVSGAPFTDPVDIEIAPSGTVGFASNWSAATTPPSNIYTASPPGQTGTNVIRFLTVAPGTTVAFTLADAAGGVGTGPWGITLIGADLWVACNSSEISVTTGAETAAGPGPVPASFVGDPIGTPAHLLAGSPLWDMDATNDSGKVFISAHFDVGPVGPDGGDPGGIVRVFTTPLPDVITLGTIPTPTPSNSPITVESDTGAFDRDVCTRPPVTFFDTGLGRRKSGGHACYVGGSGSLPRGLMPFTLLSLSGLLVVGSALMRNRKRFGLDPQID